LAVFLIGVSAAHSAQPAALTPLQFLLGDWKGVGSGKPGESAGDCSFTASLQGQVIVRNSFADITASGAQPASRHEDLMIIFAEGGKAKADYYDSEGHVIRYAILIGGPEEVIFLSEASSSSPRYRLTYQLAPDKNVKGKFEIAPPGAPEAFKVYLSWAIRKTSKNR
jgi:hypothetical protein